MPVPGSLGAAGLGEPVRRVVADRVQQPVAGPVLGRLGGHQRLARQPVDHLPARSPGPRRRIPRPPAPARTCRRTPTARPGPGAPPPTAGHSSSPSPPAAPDAAGPRPAGGRPGTGTGPPGAPRSPPRTTCPAAPRPARSPAAARPASGRSAPPPPPAPPRPPPAARRRPAVQEQPHRRRLPGIPGLRGLRRQVQRPHRADHFTGDPQRLAAGRQHPQPRRGAQQRAGQPGARIQQMLAVIQHQQQLRRPQPVDQRLQHRHITRLPHPQRLHHLRGHQPRIGDAGQLSQPHPVREPAHHARPGLQRQPGLSGPAGSRSA